MLPGVPARVAVVCTVVALLGGVSSARADRRPVVVIDLTGDATTEQLARQLGQELANHPDLQPVSDPAIPGELLGAFEDADRDLLTRAQTEQGRAEEQLTKFDFGRAEEIASAGQRALELVAPIPSTLALYAQLAFVRGQAQLGLRKPADATLSFALAHRLDPAFAPDPARSLPDVVQAFRAARTAMPGTARLTVTGTGRLWVDGTDAGTAPLELEV
ncbi:MAG: hypothetical protein H0X17_20780, partial [Deltaproteobacteria bacterium]|nr:hypothetical protein [Deltaproteobacteria bacterium]